MSDLRESRSGLDLVGSSSQKAAGTVRREDGSGSRNISSSTPSSPPPEPSSSPSSSTKMNRRHQLSLSNGPAGFGSGPGPSIERSSSARENGNGEGIPSYKRQASSGQYFPDIQVNGHTGSSSFTSSSSSRYRAPPADPTALLRVQNGVVKARSGSVLSRGYILKNDRLPPRSAYNLPFRLKGAPNFRAGPEDIYGSAQPSITGLRTVLSVLGCHPGGSNKVLWICTREEPVVYIGGSPFVLRDAEEPLTAFALSERPEALESVEKRLKNDIVREAARYGGVVQVQEEVENQETQLTSTWIAASESNVMTIRELWQSLRDEGFQVDYHRIAISSDEAPENRYLDDFLAVLRDVDTNVSLYFNCGVGVVRTTFAMTMALLVRRHQSILASRSDAGESHSRKESVIDHNVQKNIIAETNAITKRNRSLLRLTALLNDCVAHQNQNNVLELLLSQPAMLENLRRAVEGDYDMILNLLSCLDMGAASKALADAAIDRCDSVINLRESVLSYRIKLAMSAMDEKSRALNLQKAIAGLERYFFLIAFSSYVAETDVKQGMKYSEWLQARAELRNMVTRMRKPQNAVWIFNPVNDLSSLSRDAQLAAATPLAQSRFTDVLREGSEVIGDEFASQLVSRRRGITLRAGTILKKDIWRDAAEDSHPSKIRGAINFRQIEGTEIYALSQPTESGMTGVLDTVNHGKTESQDNRVTWINLREEPLVYINGAPYVLREEVLSLRNLKSYAGISATRLELIEDRLKRDILAELKAGDGRILLHAERADGTVVAVWESVEPNNVATLREIMESMMSERKFRFRRIPITAEGPPNFADVADLVEIVSISPLGHSVIINCQLGRGRSTLVSIMLTIFRRWLEAGGRRSAFAEAPQKPVKTLGYAVINNLIRVIRNGREIKMHVDLAIQQCSEIFNLLDSIEDAHQEAEQATDLKVKQAKIRRGLDDLQRYFMLVLFAAWLNESSGESLHALKEEQSFERYVKERPVFKTIQKEIAAEGAGALVPLGKSHMGEGVAMDEVQQIVAQRNGRVLSASTILKSDFFSNLQKLTLPDRVEGAPNYRRAPMYINLPEIADDHEQSLKSIYGTGMPSVEGLARALDKMGAGPDGNTWVYWTLMREEPVIFVKGRPHVLRLLAMPVENVITTGVTAETVEGQENALKSDVLREIEKCEGRLLLHDETDDGHGKFTITAEWEGDIQPEDILTPADVFKKMTEDGYRVNYARLPVTDEQAPIPRVFARLEERVEAALQHTEMAMAFNCQMGRGRTTSAMVAASLVASILHPHETSIQTPRSEVAPGLTSNLHDEDFDIRQADDPYEQGEYKIIFQLMSVLQHGKLAKRLTDTAIDQCEAVQNLRKAVASYKRQYETAETGSSKNERLGNLVFNYLYRYGTLIAFANYLLEKRDALTGAMSSSFSTFAHDNLRAEFPSFPQYLARRSEINNILSKRSLD